MDARREISELIKVGYHQDNYIVVSEPRQGRITTLQLLSVLSRVRRRYQCEATIRERHFIGRNPLNKV